MVKKDKGTKELKEKKLFHLTDEPLDLCLEKKIITEDEHKVGIHLRWLYSIKFGIQNVTTRPKFIIDDDFSPVRDEMWLTRKNFEYRKAVDGLISAGCLKDVMNLCIFGKSPSFLYQSQRTLRYNRKKFEEYNRIKTGLKTLVRLWLCNSYQQTAKKSEK